MEDKKNHKTKKNSEVAKMVVIGASVAAIAGTIYFFLGPKGKKHQEQVQAWAIKMKGDVVERLENAREVSESVYHEIIDSVATEYEKGKKATNKEIRALADDLKKHWKTISSSARNTKDNVVKSASRVAKMTKNTGDNKKTESNK